VQELGHVLNYVSVEERLPARFYPVSPPPYLNGGPEEFLSWIIENTEPDYSPELARQWLESRLPNPVNDPQQWEQDHCIALFKNASPAPACSAQMLLTLWCVAIPSFLYSMFSHSITLS